MREPQRPDGLCLDRKLKTGCIAEFNKLPASQIPAAPNLALDNFKPAGAFRQFVRRLDPKASVKPMPRPGINGPAFRRVKGGLANTCHTARIDAHQALTKHFLLNPICVGKNLRCHALIAIGHVENRKPEFVSFERVCKCEPRCGKNFRRCRATVLTWTDDARKPNLALIYGAE